MNLKQQATELANAIGAVCCREGKYPGDLTAMVNDLQTFAQTDHPMMLMDPDAEPDAAEETAEETQIVEAPTLTDPVDPVDPPEGEQS